LAYGAGGLLSSLIDARGHEKTYEYDGFGRLTRDEDHLGGFIELTPTNTSSGVSVELETTLGRTSHYMVETRADGEEFKRRTAPDGTVSERVTTRSDSTWSISSESTISTVVRHADPRFGPQAQIPSKASVRLPSGLELALTSGRKAVLSDASNPLSLTALLDSVIVNGRKFKSSYTQSNRMYVHTTPLGRVSTERLDSLGRVVKDSVAGITPWTYEYDGDGKLTRAQQGSREYEYTYDALGRLESLTDPLDYTVAFAYDATGRLTRQVLPDTNEITFGYDRNGNLTSLTPPGRPAHTFSYNGVDLAQSYIAPSLGGGSSTTEYTFDLDRQLTRLLRPDSTVINMAYDSAGRLSTVTIPRGVYEYTYSPTTGQLTGVTSPDSVELTYSYDGSVLTGVDWSGAVSGSVEFVYNNNFRVVKQRVNGADSVSFQHDNDGLLTTAGALTLTRNSANGVVTWTTLGSMTTSQTYNPFGELATYTARFNSDTLFHTEYTRDALGRIIRIIETVEGVRDTLDYTYDLVGRLTDVERNGSVVESYEYDANGNRTSFTGPSGTVTATYDDQDRLLTYGDASYSYTAAGELTMKVAGPDTTRYEYDPLGNLINVRLADGSLIDYHVDGQDRRVARRFNGNFGQALLYSDQLSPVAELDSLGNTILQFVYGADQNVPEYFVKNGMTYRVITDQLGGVRLVINTSTGQVAQRIDYDAYGQVLLNTQPGFQPFGFAGGITDANTDLIRFGYRDYDPQTGRWNSTDPIGFGGGSSNLYSYALEDPVNWHDPSGEQAIVGGAAGVAIGAATAWLTGECYSWQNGVADFAAGALGVGLASKVNKFYRLTRLRSIARSRGLQYGGRKGYVETWKAKSGFERLNIKHQAATNPNVLAGSKVPRFDYRIDAGKFWDPFTGATGPKGALSHVPLEPALRTETAIDIGGYASSLTRALSGACRCE
jgi:RHS repeat-associated protein